MVYVVTSDGYFEPYGTEKYLLGVFDNKEDAIKCKESSRDTFAKIFEVELNKSYPLIYAPEYEGQERYENDFYIGGYVE